MGSFFFRPNGFDAQPILIIIAPLAISPAKQGDSAWATVSTLSVQTRKIPSKQGSVKLVVAAYSSMTDTNL